MTIVPKIFLLIRPKGDPTTLHIQQIQYATREIQRLVTLRVTC